MAGGNRPYSLYIFAQAHGELQLEESRQTYEFRTTRTPVYIIVPCH